AEPVTSFLLLSSFAFDSSIAGIFWTLCSGGRLVVAGEETRREPKLVAEMIATQRVTHLLTLPSYYALVLEQASEKHLSSLRTVIVAGEACRAEVVARHKELMSEATLHNEYGPTEAT